MSSGPKNVTTTQTSAPPSFLLPGFMAASQGALGQFGGGFNPNQGVLTQPLTKKELKQQQRLRKQSQKLGIPFMATFGNTGQFGSMGGSNIFNGPGTRVPMGASPADGLLDQASDLTSQTLAGDFLSPDTNPFLADTFNRAADLTQTRLSSEFAGAGRDLNAALPARSQELQTLAAGIFGPNFQAERNRQMGSIANAQGLDPVNQLINRLAGLTPGAGGVTTSRQPVFQDTTGQILGGLGTAASLIGAFSDRRLKKNIQRIGTVKGYPWYSFEYVWGESSQGVMSDEVPEKYVTRINGYDAVDYGALLNG